MGPRLRRFALTVHVACSVGWLGAVAAFLALAVAGLGSSDPETVRAAYVAMRPVASYVIVPLALGALASGTLQALGTHWGLVRHYWVLVKLVVTAFATVVLLMELSAIGYLARAAAGPPFAGGDHRELRVSLVVHAAGGLLVLLVPTVLSVYKPPGRTRFRAGSP